jgi:hypothetical protein
MRVTFPRLPDNSAGYSVVERDDGVIYQMQGSRSGNELPHDLRHLIVERELGIADGIWGGIAAGTVYKSMRHLAGRLPPHAAQHSADMKRSNRDRIMLAEALANLVEAVAALENPSPDQIRRVTRDKFAVAPVTEPCADPAILLAPPPEVLAAAASALQVEAARWARLRPGEELSYEWRPASRPGVRALRSVPRPREPGERRTKRPGQGPGRPG